jgi:hypothetical protein
MTNDHDEWIAAVGRELGIAELSETGPAVTALDDLTTTVADSVGRPVAGATAFLIGVAAGRAAEPTVAARDYAQQVDALARSWAADGERGVAPNDQSKRA